MEPMAESDNLVQLSDSVNMDEGLAPLETDDRTSPDRSKRLESIMKEYQDSLDKLDTMKK